MPNENRINDLNDFEDYKALFRYLYSKKFERQYRKMKYQYNLQDKMQEEK